MNENTGTGQPEPEPPDGDPTPDFVRDWATVWQSELAAGAVDREALETWQLLSARWAAAAASPARADGDDKRAHDKQAGDKPAGDKQAGDKQTHDKQAGTDAAPRSAAAAAAPDPRDAEIARLAGRIEQLERRLARSEHREPDVDDGNANPDAPVGDNDASRRRGRNSRTRRRSGDEMAGKPPK